MYYAPYTLKGDNGEVEVVYSIISAANKWADNMWVVSVTDANNNPIPDEDLEAILK